MIDPTAGSDLSRRSLVKTAGTAAALGGALALAGPAATATAAAAAPATPRHAPTTGAPASQHDEPAAAVMVRVIDARLGTLEVYTATGHRTVTDRALAARLAPLGH